MLNLLDQSKPLYIEIKQVFMRQCVGGHNCDFIYKDVVTEVLYITDGNLTFKLYEYNGECGSGWTRASYGKCKKVDYNVNAQYKINVWEADKHMITFAGGHITVDPDGGDCYYPEGSIAHHIPTAYKNTRGDKPIIYIVSGNPNIGKSSLFDDKKGVLELDILEPGSIDIADFLDNFNIFIHYPGRNKVDISNVDTEKYRIVNVKMEEVCL